jgi:pyruvate carboxylase
VDADVPIGRIAVHFHDTHGQALSNTLTALRCGVRTIDASAGGLVLRELTPEITIGEVRARTEPELLVPGSHQ